MDPNFRDGEAVWIIHNAPNTTGIKVDINQFLLLEGSNITIGLGDNRNKYDSPAVVLNGMSAPKHVLLRSESIWLHIHKPINSSGSFRLVIYPQNITGMVYIHALVFKKVEVCEDNFELNIKPTVLTSNGEW